MKLERLLSILLLLLKEERITADFLAERFEVTKRTIYRDMESLMMAGIPIVTFSGKGGGYGLVDSYKMSVFTFSEEEKQLLYHSLDNRMQLLESKPIEELQGKIEQLSTNISPIPIRLSSPSVNRPEIDVEVKNRMESILEAIDQGFDLVFSYVSYKGEMTRRTVRPNTMLLQNGSWYVEGYCHLRQSDRMFKLTRMQDLQVIEAKKVTTPLTKSLDLPMEDKKPPMNVVLHFDKSRLGLLYDYFSKQEIKEVTADYVKVQITYEYDFDIIPFLLSFGDKVKIIEPLELIDMLQMEIKKIKEIYKS